MRIWQQLKKLDWILIISALLLVGMGLLSLYSSSMGKGNFLNFQKQIVFLGIGFLLMLLFSFFDYRLFRNNPYLILVLYAFCLIALLGLFFFAPEIRGVKAWYRIGSLSFDPIEPTKIVLIMLLAKYFSSRHIEMYRIRHIVLSCFYILLPSILIFFQPDLGSALILISLWILILVISGIKLRHFLVLCLIGVLIFSLSWSFLLRDYQKQRVLSFIGFQLEPLGSDWSQNQAKIAIGQGGIFGQGIGRGSQTQYGFLPEPQTDFIFASLAEELGLVGIGVLFSLFLILLWRIFKIAFASENNFARLFASGFGILLMAQIFINIGMNLGILPVIGIPLPLVSYGGSSLIMTHIGLGILMSIRTH